jgi:DNA-binding NarL/FixJ family response regulator
MFVAMADQPGEPSKPAKARRLPRILLAEDQEYVLAAIAAFLQERYSDRYEIVGTVRDGTALVRETLRLAPDVAVVDITIPGLNGLEATSELTRRNCGTRVVILTMNWETEFLDAALAAGAIGYVLKHRMVTDLPDAIDAALQGKRFISSSVQNTQERISKRPRQE